MTDSPFKGTKFEAYLREFSLIDIDYCYDYHAAYNGVRIKVPEHLRDWVKQFVDKDGNLDLERMDHGDAELLDYSRQPRKKGDS